MPDDNVILVGSKPLLNYITAIVTQFGTKGATEVILKARGKQISKAIDVLEIAKNKFLKDKIEVESIETSSEDFKTDEGRDIKVSAIEIKIKQKDLPKYRAEKTTKKK